MRESSLNISTKNTKKLKDIQGGEKKVMKKSLSVILSSAMALSMFSSVAFGATAKTSADFTDLKDLTADQKAKFDAMISAGIFDGVADGKFGLNDKMNRAQFAKVAALIFHLDVDTTLKTSSFSDVKADDAANGYALPYIEAVKKAGITDGYGEGIYNPAGEVTKEQLAAFIIRGLGKDAEAKATPGVSDKTVSDWAKGYVAYALASKLVTNGADGTFGGTVAAIRALLVEASYGAKQAYVPPAGAKASVTEVKGTGVKTVTVKFNKAVDDTKATLSLKKGSVALATTTKFADDKKSATITLTDTKLMAGDYTVTLGGLDATVIGTATGTFTAQDESVQKIEFVSANDTLALSNKVIVKLKATNQYGENASFSAGNYTVYAGANNNDVFVKMTKSDAGELLLTLNTTVSGYTSGLSVIPVNIYNNDTRVTASKNFKLGTAPFATKMELGTLKYSTGKDALTGTGEAVSFDVTNYDQYGNVIASNPTDRGNTRVILNGYEPAFATPVIDDANNDDVTDIKISLASNLDKNGDYTFSVYNQAGNATVKVAVKAGKVATKLELGEMTDVIAAGDTNAYIPLIAYDANGTQLTTDELVSSSNATRIKPSANATLVTAGDKKGKLLVTSIPNQPKSVVSVSASISEVNANSYVSKTYTVSDARTPDSIVVSTNPATKTLAGATSAFKFLVKDQYGKDLGTFKNIDTAGNVNTTTTPDATNKIAQYRVHFVATAGGTGVSSALTTQDFLGAAVGTGFNQEYNFVAGNTVTAAAYAQVTAVVQKSVDTTNWTDVSNVVTKKIEALTSADALTYKLNTVSDLFNAVDSASVTASTYDSGASIDVPTQENASVSKFAREVTVSAIDAAGNTVALPKSIKSITSSNPQVVITSIDPSTKKGFVIGNKKGTANLNVAFETNKGETLLQTVAVNVKDDLITSKTVAVGNSTSTLANAQLVANKNAFVLMNVKVTDNYGIEFAGATAQKYNYLFGVVFTVKNVDAGTATTNNTVTVDQYGNLNIGSSVVSFELVATSAAGFSATTFVK
jgi:hypothetical protein